MGNANDEPVTNSVSKYAEKTLSIHSRSKDSPLITQAHIIRNSKRESTACICVSAAFLALSAFNMSLDPDEKSSIKGGFQALVGVVCALRGIKKMDETEAHDLVFETMHKHNPQVVMTMLEGMKDKKFPEQLRQRAPRFY